MQSPSKLSSTTAVSTSSAVSGLQGWADLPNYLLHSIVALLGSFIELSAFSGTCRSWRAAFYSYPFKSTFCTLFPPLLVRPNVRIQTHLPSNNGRHKLRTCKVIDLANQNTTLCCQIPQETFQKMHFAGSSYGHLICCRDRFCLVVDVFTGAEVLPPRLPFSGDSEEFYFGGTLTAPLTSSNSHLLVSTRSSLFDWPVGSDTWSELRLSDARIDQILEFNDQFIAMDYSQRIYTLQLAPQLGLQEITTKWWDGMTECPYLRPWLVVCGNMLLMVDHYMSLSFGAPVLYKPYRLDMSTKPAKWVEVKKLDNWALFVGGDVRSPPFSCMNPERWGGRSNRLYYAHNSQPWSVHGLGDEADAAWDSSIDPDLVYKRNWYRQLQAFWVYPSMLYSNDFPIMQNPREMLATSVSAPHAVSELQGWADLPHRLLHSIVALLGSFMDLTAFAGVCCSWRAAFYSYPSRTTFRTLFPPLLVRPNIRVQAPQLPSKNGRHKLRTCKLIDLANQNTTLRCQIPEETFQKMHFVGCSFGHLISCLNGYCLIVDVFTGTEVSPPRLSFSGNSEEEFYFGGTLTAPLTSSNSHLLVSTGSSLFDWPVGSDFWYELRLSEARIDQILEFNGQFIAMDYNQRIYTLQLAPQLGLQEITTEWWDGMTECPYLRPWLVVCDDMLLMVDHYMSLSFGAPVLYKPYRLDMSTKPAKWVEVKKLDSWALFVGGDVRSPPFSCVNPERWGGRSNCLYYAHYSQPWSVHGLGDEADAVWDLSTDPDLVYKRNWYRQLQSFWVYPSMFYSNGQ